MSVSDRFISDLSILREAGTSLIVTRTREPFEVATAVRQYVIGANKEYAAKKDEERLAYGSWNALDGLLIESCADLEFNQRNAFAESPHADKKQAINGVKDALKALQLLANKLTDEEKKLCRVTDGVPVGVYDFIWPQGSFEKDSVKAVLLYLAEEFTYCSNCLVLIVPMTAIIPPELLDFITFLDFDPPAAVEREVIIDRILADYDIELDDSKPIVKASAAMTGFELKAALSVLLKEMLVNKKEITTHSVAKGMMIKKTDIIKRTQILEIMPEGDISQIGGLENVKDYLHKASRCYSDAAHAFGVDRPKGIGVFGIPGSGKTALAKVAGSVMGFPVLRLDISRILKKYVGESEGMMRIVFGIIKAMAPCGVFIDEIDKFFSGSGDDAGGGTVSRRILGMILSFMQENTDPVFFILAANNIDNIPSEMLRKQRLNELFYVGLPTKAERTSVFRIHLAKRHQNPDRLLDLSVAVKAARGYVAAEIEAAVQEAVQHAFLEETNVTGALMAEKLSAMKPLASAYPAQFQKMQEWAEKVARPASLPEDDEEENNVMPLSAGRKKKSKEK